ncbi:MAG: hypothetical protein OSA42_03915 [Porticoccaceae bacterium]|nr:hypothetical protein [Porticoccaceae bacterium]
MSVVISPTQTLRRSQLYRRHRQLGADFAQFGDSIAVDHYGDDEVSQARVLGLADLSTLPRIGFKGLGTPVWADSCGVKQPAQPNWATLQGDNTLVARLSSNELLLASNLTGSSKLIETLATATRAHRVYALPRGDSHSWLSLCGEQAANTLAKVCAIDFRAQYFTNLQIAQTSLAKINAVIVRTDIGDNLNYAIFSDSCSLEYLWDSLLDAMSEYRGRAIGLQALRDCATL